MQPAADDFNFYKAIEQLPRLPLQVKLQAKNHIHILEKQIQLKKKRIEKQRAENLKTQEKLEQ